MFKILGITFAALGFLLAAVNALQAANPQVLIKTSLGDITIELNQEKAPISVKNFLNYVDEKFYDGTIFHRVIRGFMIQGGGLTADLHEKISKPPIKNEAANGLKNNKGTIAMARTPEIDSATNQFFINLADNDFLNHQSNDPDKYGYAVFGKVIAGMDVVNAIAKVPTGSKNGFQDVPRDAVTILSVTRLENK